LIGSALGGSLLIAANYRRLGHVGLARTTLAIGAVATGVDLFAALRLHIAFSFMAVIAFGGVHRAIRDGGLFDVHTAGGGLRCSSWRALAAAAVGFSAVLGHTVIMALESAG
jgi:hypothetical protein